MYFKYSFEIYIQYLIFSKNPYSVHTYWTEYFFSMIIITKVKNDLYETIIIIYNSIIFIKGFDRIPVFFCLSNIFKLSSTHCVLHMWMTPLFLSKKFHSHMCTSYIQLKIFVIIQSAKIKVEGGGGGDKDFSFRWIVK